MNPIHPTKAQVMFVLLRAIVWATLFVAFGLVFLPSWLLRKTP